MSYNLNAQTISVVDFRLDVTDLTANSTETQVFDQNGDKCALIRVQTTQKGFIFDVGSLGVQKVDDNHVGEIWVYVSYGTRHISIRHPQLGSLSTYDFPIQIQKARTYILEITHDKVFVNNYDDSRKQTLLITTLPNAELTINGAVETIGNTGELSKILSFGTYTYKIEAKGYFQREGQITIDNPDAPHVLMVKDLRPIMGSFSLKTNVHNPSVLIDGKIVTGDLSVEPMALQIGEHKLEITASGYHKEERNFEVKEDETTELSLTLNTEADFEITTEPSGASLKINGEEVGTSPILKTYQSGTYRVVAQLPRYRTVDEDIYFDSSNPQINIPLMRILNYKNQFYFGGNANLGSLFSYGATIGCYISNINLEANYNLGFTAVSEKIYWKQSESAMPYSYTYTPSMMIGLKIGYGISVGKRLRITPQFGANFLKLKESAESVTSFVPADGAYNISATVGAALNFALVNHVALFLTPEYAIQGLFATSDGYKALSSISEVISKWNKGVGIKSGLLFFF